MDKAACEGLEPLECTQSRPTFVAGYTHMDQVCTAYTRNVAWRHILGLGLSEAEIPTFVKATK